MKRNKSTIRQGVVTELATEVAKKPEREKTPDGYISLLDLFRTKEHAEVVKGALKKGYSFEDLAEILSEKCGVTISGRQIRIALERAERERREQTREGKGR
jgi:hypothetical protein